MPHAVLCRKFLLPPPPPCCFMWGVSLTNHMLFYMGSFLSYPSLFCVGSFFYTSMVFPVGTFSYTPGAGLCGECVLNTLCYFMPGICLTHPVLFYVRSLS